MKRDKISNYISFEEAIQELHEIAGIVQDKTADEISEARLINILMLAIISLSRKINLQGGYCEHNN